MAKMFGFLSYARADSEHVLAIAKQLREAGAPLWLDQLDIVPGDRWDRAVELALQTCDCLVVMLSPAAVRSENVMDEVAYAIDEGKRIVPVLLESCEIPLRLRRRQYIDLTRGDSDALHAIASAISPVSAAPKEITPESHAIWRSEVSLTLEKPYLFATDLLTTDDDLRRLSAWQSENDIERLIVTLPAKGKVSVPGGMYPIYPVWSSLSPNTYREILRDLSVVSGGCALDTDIVLAFRFKDDPSYSEQMEQMIDGLIQVSPMLPSVEWLGQFERVVLDPSGVTFIFPKGAKEYGIARSQALWKKPRSTQGEIKLLAQRLTLLNPDTNFEQHLQQLTTRPSDLRVAVADSDGLVIPYGLASEYFALGADGLWRKECYCLLSQSTITQPVLQQVLAISATLEKPLVVFATGISHKALVFSVTNKLRGTAVFAAIVCPDAELKRIGAYLGADFPNIDSIRSPAELGNLPWIALTASAWGAIIERRTPPPKKRRNLNRSRRHG